MGSVLWVREKPGGKSGGQDECGRSSYHNEWTVKCSSPTMTRTQVLACGLLPVYGSPNAENLKAVCIKTDARRKANAPCYWDASADWQESPISGRDPADEQKQPDQRRPQWRGRFIPFPMARFADYDGKPLVDKAGTPFDPVPDMPMYVDEITVSQYEATCDRPAQRGFMGAYNTDTWLGAQPGEALVDDISVDEEFIQGVYWYLTTYQILVKPYLQMTLPKGARQQMGGWNPEYILNAGPMALVQDTTTQKWSKRAVTHGGYYDGRSTFLNSDGTQIPIDDTDGSLSADPVFLEFRTRNGVAFSALNLVPPDGWVGA